MEYEHKYKTALKIASELYKEGTINETLIKVFPELIGLEDERIKREVIKEITFYVRDCDEKEKMLNWLEKQGEQKSVDKVEPFDKYEGLTDFERTLADICIGWIGEEPGWKQYIKDNADVLLKIAIEKFNSVQDTLFEQKPAWSEEDEKMYKGINNTLNYYITKFRQTPSDLLADEIIKERNWFKSLKQRIIKYGISCD